MTAESKSISKRLRSYAVPERRHGPRYAQADNQLALLQDQKAEGATWRGWLIGLLSIAAIALLVPKADFAVYTAEFSFNAFPMLSVALLLALTGFLYAGLLAFRSTLGLTRQDLVLVFAMTMTAYTIPGVGFWVFYSVMMTGAFHYARPENQWEELIQPHLTEGFFPRDVPGGARPIEWFYVGLPPGQEIPWEAWSGPFLRWSLAVVSVYGISFALSALLQRRWANRERLAFPVAQVPEEMIGGTMALPQGGGLFRNKLFWIGLGCTFLIHAWNSLHQYMTNWPPLPTMNWHLERQYLTEPPWKDIGVVNIHFYPSIIGLTYFLSLEVAFSLWIFYALQKVLNLFFSNLYGAANLNEMYHSQGVGALLAMVIACLWAARTDLGRSFLRSFGLGGSREDDEVPRWVWPLLLVSLAGAFVWLCWYGVDAVWAAGILALFVLLLTAFARLVAETGVFATQIGNGPADLLASAATPAALGAKNVALLSVWDKTFAPDWFRLVPMPFIMNALHLCRGQRLRMGSALSGMAVGMAVMLALSFFSFLHMIYDSGGANRMAPQTGWFFTGMPEAEFKKVGNTIKKLDGWERKQAKFAEEGKPIPPQEVPKEAKIQSRQLGWMGVGAGTMVVFLVARKYLFWWPHPAGYVLWMANTIDRLWFAFFMGWLLKWAITTYGGMRVYRASRSFFVGLVAGECLAAVTWGLLNLALNHPVDEAITIH